MRRAVLNYLLIAALVVSAAFTSCGGGSGSSGGSSGGKWKIKMTTESSRGRLYLAGSGTATVDWGDGTEKVTLTLNESYNGVEFRHDYPNATIRTITINGENITKLYCRESKLTSLDVSKATALTELDCYHNQLTSLDVSKCTALTSLECSTNQLTSLVMGNNNVLSNLECIHNQLTSFDVSKCTALTKLECSTNQLTSLDVSKCTALKGLFCRSNQLSSTALNDLFGTLPATSGSINCWENPGYNGCDRSIAEKKGWKVQ